MPTPKDIITPATDKAAQTADKVANKIEVKGHVKSGKMKGRKVTVLLDADELVKDQVGGFVNFVREHAIVGLAIGFIIGAQAQAVVRQLVDSFITPTIGLIFGGSLKTQQFVLRGEKFTWGAMIYALINLLAVLATIYILIKVLKLDKLDKPKEKPAVKTKKSDAHEAGRNPVGKTTVKLAK